MPTPTPTQARSHYARQAAIAEAGTSAIWPMFAQGLPLPVIGNALARYQLRAVLAAVTTFARWAEEDRLVDPSAFAGVSSYGFPVLEPFIATIDRYQPAPVEPLPDTWWTDATLFQNEIELLIASEIADAARTASQAEMVGHGWTEYVRVLTPPSCSRCTILAGRKYRWSTGFLRHPGCDCVMVPVDDPRAADRLLTQPDAAFEAGQVGSYRTSGGERVFVPGASKADLRAIAAGADPAKVVNATRGLGAPGVTAAGRTELFGRRVKYTSEATTKRAAWRKDNPSRLVRLRPEAIFQFATDPQDAVRLLRLYGYM